MNTQSPVKSLNEFINLVSDKIKNIEAKKVVWFRGEPSNEYKLVPNLYRITSGNKSTYCEKVYDYKVIHRIEQNMDANFERKASIFLANKGIENTPWNRYYLKQHYKVKTRLRDWTENALIALFFSIEDNSKLEFNARVWILDPFKLNDYSLNKFCLKNQNLKIIMNCGKLKKKQELFNDKQELRLSEIERRYYRLDCEDIKELYPIAIYPIHLDERMVAQQSCFTLFGNIVRGLDCNDTKENFLDYVDISANAKLSILNELRLLGISYYSIFPDLDGLGKTVNKNEEEDLFDALTLNNIKYHFNAADE
jgi:hypothetical protein